jgi:CheY-like chemotaxis protein
VIDTMKADERLKHIPIVVVTAKELTVREREYLDRETELLVQKGSFVDDAFVQKLIERLK